MVSVIATGAFNALAFAGAGFLFKMLDGKKYRNEMEPRAKAAHELAVRKKKFYEQQVLRKNKIDDLRRKIAEAEKSEKETDIAFAQLNKAYSGRKNESYEKNGCQSLATPTNRLMK